MKTLEKIGIFVLAVILVIIFWPLAILFLIIGTHYIMKNKKPEERIKVNKKSFFIVGLLVLLSIFFVPFIIKGFSEVVVIIFILVIIGLMLIFPYIQEEIKKKR